MYSSIIRKCSLFTELSEEDYSFALNFFAAFERSYEKGTLLSHPGIPLSHFGLVLSGTIQVYANDVEGNTMIMNNVRSGETFGESLCFLGIETSIYIQAVTDCRILWMDTGRLSSTATPLEHQLIHRFTAMLAHRTLAMNDRIQILSKLTLRDKLITFFSQYCHGPGEEFLIPFRREDMALYLGTNRSALSRELSRMRNEGLISFQKNHFKLLK